ncbi:hypothetical protein M0804_009859, partial [Polistes exclamans]
ECVVVREEEEEEEEEEAEVEEVEEEEAEEEVAEVAVEEEEEEEEEAEATFSRVYRDNGGCCWELVESRTGILGALQDMSVFTTDDRILLEEIVEADTEEHEVELCGSIEKVEESSVTSITAAVEATDNQQQRQQSKSSNAVAAGRRLGGGAVGGVGSGGVGGIGVVSGAAGAGAGAGGSVGGGGGGGGGQNVALNGNNVVGRVTPRSHMEQEKRIRREIANSNERRRMQSINAGFQSLRTLLPHHEGEKLSKSNSINNASI